MPKVALTDQQRRDNAKRDICHRILVAMNARAGAMELQKKDFAEKCGISHTTWWKWNKTQLETASLCDVLEAAMRAGVKIDVSVDARIS